MNNIGYLLALHGIDGLGPIRLKALLDYFKDPKLAWHASESDLYKIGLPKSVIEQLSSRRHEIDPNQLLERIQKAGIKWLSIFDEGYPFLLKQIYDPPTVLYFRGEISIQNPQVVAVVGTRKPTGYGREVTRMFTKVLADAGLTIVSGLARGVDSEAHKTTLQAGGVTAAVLGGGLNKIYPPENIRLADEIAENGGVVLSEFPPDHPHLAGNFPARNRIIAGLSKGVLVTEAASDSGSLITARLALEQGRDVFAVPGPVTSLLSRGAVDLIKEGARAVFEPKDILEELNIPATLSLQNKRPLSNQEAQVLEVLINESLHIDEICRQLKLPAANVSGTLLRMEIAGLVRNLGGGLYCKS